MSCPFCALDPGEIVLEGERCLSSSRRAIRSCWGRTGCYVDAHQRRYAKPAFGDELSREGQALLKGSKVSLATVVGHDNLAV